MMLALFLFESSESRRKKTEFYYFSTSNFVKSPTKKTLNTRRTTPFTKKASWDGLKGKGDGAAEGEKRKSKATDLTSRCDLDGLPTGYDRSHFV